MRRSVISVAVLAVLAVLATVSVPTLSSPALAEHSDESVVDLTFPVAEPADGTWFSDDFHAARSGGRTHEATDIMAPKHRPIHAAVGGVVSYTPYPEPSYGWMLSINGDDGRMYRYIHINNDTPGTTDGAGGPEHAFSPKIADAMLAKGSTLDERDDIRVERGELVAYVGDSGNAGGTPHLHFEMFEEHSQSAPRINPYASLQDALDRGDIPGDEPTEAAEPSEPTDPSEPTQTSEPTEGSEPETVYVDGPFDDLAEDGAHTDAILRLAEAGIVTACDGESYCPYDAVLRGDLAAFLAAALDLTADEPPRFADIEEADENGEAIAAVDEAGILQGVDEDTFGADQPLSRAQLATMLVQGFAVPTADLQPPFDDFADVDADGLHTANITATYESGLTVGCDDGTVFCPWDDVSRGQVASFLDRALAEFS